MQLSTLIEKLSVYPTVETHKENESSIPEYISIEGIVGHDDEMVEAANDCFEKLKLKHEGKDIVVRVMPEIGDLKNIDGTNSNKRMFYTRLQFI